MRTVRVGTFIVIAKDNDLVPFFSSTTSCSPNDPWRRDNINRRTILFNFGLRCCCLCRSLLFPRCRLGVFQSSTFDVTDFFEWSDTDAVTMMGDPVSSVY